MVKTLFKNLSLKEYLILFFYCVPLVGLFFYSFTQIDLSLALSRNEALQEIVRSFQQIGYFDRPLSATLFVSLVVILFVFYVIFLRLATKKKIQKKFTWILIGAATIILTFSYNAFSYDIFNYIFDAKIITHYGDNPYVQKALDYPEDPMLSFMRWTHREYPYGPFWLVITVPLSFIGLQFFLPTFFLFKLLMIACFIGSVFFIGKILKTIAPEREVMGLIFFGLNPLMLIESVVSPHIDIVMMFFALWAFYFMIIEKHGKAYGLLFLSIAIKFVTAVLLPLFVVIHRMKAEKIHRKWGFIIGIAVILLIGGAAAQSYRGTFQPWYLIDVLAFAALISYRYYVLIPAVIVSFFSLMNYVPFLFTGNWDKPIPQILLDMNFLSYTLAFLIITAYFFYKQILFARQVKRKKKK